MLRTCTKCLNTYPREFFNSDRTKTDGKHPHCKNCTRRNANRSYRRYRNKHMAMKRAWKEANPERNAEINQRWKLDNPERHAQNVRQWRLDNSERHAENNRQWRLNNREAARAADAAYKARLKSATPSWVDREMIALIRSECPPGWRLRFIEPLAGKNSCGLNVPWNLQCLPPKAHGQGTKLPVDAGGHDHL